MPIGAFRLNTLSAAMAAAASPIIASGGTISYFYSSPDSYKIHKFATTGSNNFIVSSGAGNADILLVGGGGAGGGATTAVSLGGGGGGGAVVYQTGVPISSQTYTISVGAGGTGISGAAGNSGSTSTGLGYTANGGGAGTVSSAATNGGGSGTNSTTSYTSTIGTYAYKGGNSFGSATTASRASGGGAGAGGAGSNATSATGGDGGKNIQNNIDGQNLYYANGGGGSGTTPGYVYDNTGATGSSEPTYGAGRNGNGNGNGNTGQYGGGGGGASNNGTTARSGGAGNQGIVVVRYPITDYLFYSAYSETGISATTTIPATANVGDIVLLFDMAVSSAIPSEVVPTGWTKIISITSNSTNDWRYTLSYKKLVSGDPGSNITAQSATTGSKLMLIYKTNFSTVTLSAVNNQSNSASGTLTNQTLTMSSVNGPMLGIAAYTSISSLPTNSSTVTPSRTVLSAGTPSHKIITFERVQSTDTAFSNSTISMNTGSQIGMISFTLAVT
ncbi:hypothetical protein UFOVP647_5 [uncultured Caudovirales phage]|uniref:Glycine-rich domain-containing protein n=1 Tax=uncultured Caudovirales phage TaxID=2100421 RepID=A0A6J5N6X4_9CAUD|nr:hypothetical protein UFOVP647_5 [uncultured Caudovirales phage]